jgi:single-strand DNA-binding protein
MNRVTLVGHLGKDPEVRRFENGSVVATFTLATTERYKDKNGEFQENTDWHNIAAWRNSAERAEKFFKKGKLVFVEGRITSRKYTDKEGVERSITEILATDLYPIERLGDGPSRNAPPPPSEQDAPPMRNANPAATTPKVSFEVTNGATNANAGEDDLPF